MTGQLFTHYFLTDGIKTTPEWQASVEQSETLARLFVWLALADGGYEEERTR